MSFDENTNRPRELGELRADVRHLQSDVTEIKADVRMVRRELGEKFDAANARTEAVRTELTTKIEALFAEIGKIKDSIASAKLWALSLHIGLAGGIFYALARGFKWI